MSASPNHRKVMQAESSRLIPRELIANLKLLLSFKFSVFISTIVRKQHFAHTRGNDSYLCRLRSLTWPMVSASAVVLVGLEFDFRPGLTMTL